MALMGKLAGDVDGSRVGTMTKGEGRNVIKQQQPVGEAPRRCKDSFGGISQQPLALRMLPARDWCQ